MRPLILLLLILCSVASFAQKQIDHADSIVNARKRQLSSKLDSLKDKGLPDSLKHLSIKPVSIKLPGTKVDSLFDAGKAKITHVKDSIDGFVKSKTSFLDSMQMNISNPVNGRSSSFKLDADSQAIPGGKIDGLSKPSLDPSVNLDPAQLGTPKIDAVGDLKEKVNDIKQLPNEKMNDMGAMKEINELKGKVGEIKTATSKVEEYSKELKNIKEGSVDKVKTISQDAEQLATKNVSELKDLQKETKQIDAAKNMIEQYKDMVAKINKDKLEEQGKDLVNKQFTDHLTPNIEKLKGGVAQLDKLKRKYGDIADSRYLPKRPVNELKGKPFIERIVPGINFQILQGNVVKIDVSPFAMYRITPRWRAGLGGTKRIGFGKKMKYVDDNVTYGFRTMSDFNVWGGFNLHAEYELIHTTPFNPGLQSFDPKLPQKWVPGLNAGILKRYRVSKKIYGNFQVLYNFLYEYNGLYQNKLNVRFGFEFPLKKKERDKK